MITIKNRFIPLRGFMAMTLWSVVFVRTELYDRFGTTARRHERIHLAQQLEVMLASLALLGACVLGGLSPWWLCAAPAVYYVLYCAEWIVRLAVCHDGMEAYMGISFERQTVSFRQENDF